MKDEIGNKYGRWTVLEFSHIQQAANSACYKWLCRCECGTERAVNMNALRRGISTSCGCYNREVTSSRSPDCKLPDGEASRNQLWHAYKRGAEKRGLSWEISKDEFEQITKQDCHYCGIKPMQVNRIPHLNGFYTYNGIDRKDSSKGYILGNCVPCCKRCNYAKRESTEEEFQEWIDRLLTFQRASVRVKSPSNGES